MVTENSGADATVCRASYPRTTALRLPSGRHGADAMLRLGNAFGYRRGPALGMGSAYATVPRSTALGLLLSFLSSLGP